MSMHNSLGYLNKKTLFGSRAHSYRAFYARDSFVALRARSYILHIVISLFLVILYRSSSQFYNIVDVNYIFTKLLNFLISHKTGNFLQPVEFNFSLLKQNHGKSEFRMLIKHYFFRISHIIVKKLNFGFSFVFFF